MVLMLLITSKVAGQSTTPCNSFPKIFGGSLNVTFSLQIDIYNDYLAFGGDTYDTGLSGKAGSTPYLALSSISTGGKYYWANAFTLMSDVNFVAV
jgi:hypothetical protein